MDNSVMLDRIEKIQIDRIGASCFFDSISCSLEYMDKLYWALEYIQYKFLYNKESFLSFKNDSNLEKLLSVTDKYYFRLDPESSYRIAISKYDINLLEKKLKDMIQFEEIDERYFYKTIYSLKNEKLPAVLLVNNLLYKEFYEEHKFTVPRSDCHHKINLLSVSDDGSRVFVYDRGFDCFGEWIDVDKLYKGATSPYLENKGKVSIFYFKQGLPPKLDKLEICNLLKDNLQNFFKGKVIIDGVEYLNNRKALISFRRDLKDIVYELEEKYGDFAAALMGEALVQQVDGAMGLAGLYRDINKYLQCLALEETC